MECKTKKRRKRGQFKIPSCTDSSLGQNIYRHASLCPDYVALHIEPRTP